MLPPNSVEPARKGATPLRWGQAAKRQAHHGPIDDRGVCRRDQANNCRAPVHARNGQGTRTRSPKRDGKHAPSPKGHARGGESKCVQGNSTPKPCGDQQKVGAMLPYLQRERGPLTGWTLHKQGEVRHRNTETPRTRATKTICHAAGKLPHCRREQEPSATMLA